MSIVVDHALHFTKDSPAVIALSQSDKALAVLIERIGDYTLYLRDDYFASLVRAVVGQQLSVMAARTIWLRICAVCDICPEAILAIPEDELRSAGLSRPKISYIKDLSHQVLLEALPLDTLHLLSDTEVIETLTRVKGIGRWTAEMFLVFSLGRLDILSLDDAGLRKAIKWLYDLRELPSRDEMAQIGEQWSPYRSVASLYLWQAVDRKCVTNNCR